jgi:hypothetical protein
MSCVPQPDGRDLAQGGGVRGFTQATILRHFMIAKDRGGD